MSNPPIHTPSGTTTSGNSTATAPRRHRLRRVLRWVALSVVVLLVLIGGFVAYLLGTESGARFAFSRLGALMPGAFSVDRLEGPISSPLTIHGLHYRSDSAEVRVETVELTWRLRELLSKQLDIRRLHAQGVRITTVPAPKKGPTTLPDLHLHFNIIVHDAQVRDLTVASKGAPGPPLKIDSIDLATSEIADRVRIDQLAVRSPTINADVTGAVQPQGDYPVDLKAQWQIRPAGMAEVKGGGTLTGTLAKLQVAQAVTAPFPVRLDATLDKPLDSLAFDARVAFSGVDPRLLKASLPAVQAPASGEVVAKGTIDAFTSSGTVRGAIDPAGAVAVRYDIQRDGDDWKVAAADITFPGSPMTLHAQGRASLKDGGVFDADLQTSWHALAWPPRGKPSFESSQGEAKLTAKGSTDTLDSQGTVRATIAPPVGALAVDYRVSRRGAEWKVAQADVTFPGTPTRVALQGTATQRGPQLRLDAHTRWSQLAWPLRGTPTVKSAQGEATVSGSLDRYRLQVQGDLAAGPANPAIRPGHWNLAGEGDMSHFQLASLDGDVLGGHLSGHGDVAWKPAVRWQLALAGQGIDPAIFRPDFPGKLDFAANTAGTLRSDGPAGTLDLQKLQGTLRQQAIAGTANVALAGQSADVKHLDVKWGTAHLAASGRVGTGGSNPAADLAFDLSDPNLALALPQAAGAVTAKGHVSGSLKTPRVQATVTGQGLRFAEQSVNELKLTADVDLAPRGTIVLDLQAAGIAASGQTLRQVTLSGRGTIESHALRTTLQGLGEDADSRLDLAVKGGLSGGLSANAVWRGEIDTLSFKMKPLDPWNLSAPVTLAASAKAAQLGRLCATSGPGTLCAQGSWVQGGPWNGEATLDKLPIQEFAFLLPKNVSVTGDLNATMQARGGPKGLTSADFHVTPGPGEVRFPGDDGRVATFHYENLSLQGKADTQGGNATLAMTLANIGQIGGQVVLPRLTQGVPLKNQPLSGKISADLNSLRFLHAFAPDVTNLAGVLTARFDLEGTVGEPRLRGEAKLTGGQATLAAYGLNLKEIGLTATGDGSGSLALHAAARSGEGTVAIEGKTGMVPSAATPLHLTVRGKRFQAMGMDEINVLISPDLTLDYQGTLAKVTGDVTVPQARIKIEDQKKSGVVPVSRDVVFINGPKEGPEMVTKSPLAVSARVRLILDPTNIRLTALGLDAKPTGSLLLVQQPGGKAIGTGELELQEGTFKAYGQDLSIERGRLIFAGGPVDNPGIDIRASRKADDGTVAGIEATGTVKSPQVTLFSTPAMAEADALAYILLGHPLGQASPQEGSLVANAAASLGLKGGNLIGKRVAQRFGLEQATFESKGGLDQTSLVLGKYLTPKLYVVYGIGLFEPINTFRIRYILSSKFTLQADSGSTSTGATGADILYTLQR